MIFADCRRAAARAGEALRPAGGRARSGAWAVRWGGGAHRLRLVNRAPRWLLPTVLAALLFAVVIGTLLR